MSKAPMKRPSKSMPQPPRPKGLKPSPAGSKTGTGGLPGKKKRAQMGGKLDKDSRKKDPKKIGIMPSKEVKFGKPDIPKSDYSKAESAMPRKKKAPGLKPSGSKTRPTAKRYKAQGGAFAERVTRAREREAGIDNSSLTSAGFSRPGASSSKPKTETPRGGAETKPKPKANPYADAKKRDPELDKHIKARNAAERGSREYNEAQNKINRAYGKGPIRKVEPMEKTKSRGPAQVENKSAPKPTLQTRSKPTPPPAPKSQKEQRTDKKVARITERKNKREDNAADRSFARNERKGKRADNKQDRLDRRDRIREAKGKQPRQKAQAGALVAGAGQAAKGVGSLVNAIAGKETKFGNIANAAGDVAGGIGSMMGPGGAAVNKVGGALNNAAAGGAGAAGAAGANAAPGATPDANTPQQDPNTPNQRYGGMKKKRRGGKMKYKGGGAKPDYNESMRSALKDRRKRRGGRR